MLYAAGACRGPFPMAAAIVLAAALYGSVRLSGRQATACFALAGALILLLAAGAVPGFARLPLGHLSINSAKALAGLATLAVFPSFWAWNRACSAVAAACLVGVPLLAWSVGFVRWAPVAPHAWIAFAATNVFTVIAEEWFFRHWVQRPLARWSPLAGLVASALLFGLVHLAGGFAFAGLAALAGLAYAGVYAASRGSIWAAVALHGTLNLLRVALFGL